MAWFLGIDTSNYTTSAALYNSDSGEMVQQKQLLPVREGELGLRQSDAVFAHTKQLGALLEALFAQQPVKLAGIGVSSRPRDVQGSYMPCFLVGETTARGIAAAAQLPITFTSHQAGHIAAALYSAGKLDLMTEPFAAFHFSGGTTEAVLVSPSAATTFETELFASSLDLKAGQAIDRIGGMLGLAFPAGMELEALALRSQHSYQVRPAAKGRDCSLSGLQNQCEKMLRDGSERPDIARFCIDSILAAVRHMTQCIREEHPNLPILYSGGVMSNTIIRSAIEQEFGGYFAQPQFSSDNAAGVAILAAVKQRGGAQQ